MSPLCVYCGSSIGNRPEFAAAASELGLEMGRRKIDLVYGGGRAGMMGLVADAVLERGGHVFGVITRQLVDMETAHTGLRDLHVVETMHQRKMMMAERAGAFVAIPGGVGTLDEFFEIVAWAQLGIHAKPMGLLNTAGFFDHLLAMMDQMQSAGFLRIRFRERVCVADTPAALLESMSAVRAGVTAV
ncbi:MAG: TIGR00730 family Rossman fold protein [Phycisphaerales bacterium]